ncbi:hypothetical protein NE237_018521 [Protea cynaroides]|uniref:Uncharacterized protein n=1 Tax=Protea cynaroides TaxID=273540 RepID=A0A9Q0QP28_9MAGN|nr:hypothetical protein NE237_018521 [Protea cynaroides]
MKNFYSKLEATGWPKRYIHVDYQFEYDDFLATECECSWRKLRYDATCRNRQVRLEMYRGVWEDQILVSKERGDSVPFDENGHHNPSQLCIKELEAVNKKMNKEPGKDFQVLMSWWFFVQVTTSHGLNITKMSNGKIMDIKKLWWSAKMSSGEITVVKKLWEFPKSLFSDPFAMVDLGCSCGGNTDYVIDCNFLLYLHLNFEDKREREREITLNMSIFSSPTSTLYRTLRMEFLFL